MSVHHRSSPISHVALVCTFAALVLSAAGCSLFNSSEPPGTRQWSDQMGHGMRGPQENAASAGPEKKTPFWEKYRDKRVGQINNNLSVEEPNGW